MWEGGDEAFWENDEVGVVFGGEVDEGDCFLGCGRGGEEYGGDMAGCCSEMRERHGDLWGGGLVCVFLLTLSSEVLG